MDLFSLILEAIVWLCDLSFLWADVYSWIQGRANRIKRRESRKAGVEIPPRDRWNKRVILLSGIVIVLTAILVISKWKAR